ncbi:hypothetical protein [Chitinophaga sp. 212800010-3]|uniref:hypothetical protein n=1 Tax=unclassified Chitinophaga TaxID=2619133 RepID=UPI002DE60438|nr:Cell wall anchor protein [Chitinophaga sp. 212800010-3]
MKKIFVLLTVVILLQCTIVHIAIAQARDYFTNYLIPGQTEDSKGVNYLILHRIYSGTLMPDNFIMGKITAVRGGVAAWNRKWVVEVNTSSAYNANRGSIICYNEPATLVTLTYNGMSYLAVSVTNSSSLYSFSFTGYAQNVSLAIAYHDQVSNVQPFTDFDPVTIQGNVGIGTTSTGVHKLAVEGSIGARKVKVAATGWADYVFEENYALPSLQELERYVKEHKHLPEIPTAVEVEREGIDLGEMNKKLLQKVEELTLYLIEERKVNEAQEERIRRMEEEMGRMKREK